MASIRIRPATRFGMVGGEDPGDGTATRPSQQDEGFRFAQRVQQCGEFICFVLGAAVAIGGVAPGVAGAVVGADARVSASAS